VRAGLLHVHMLTGLAGPHGLQRVIVIRRGDGNRVNGFVVQQLAQIREGLRTLLTALLDLVQTSVQDGFVDIADRRDLDILHRTVTGDVRAALTVDPYASNAYRVIGTWSGPLNAGGRGKRSHQEMSSFHRFTILPVGRAD